jgi:hypothetical protein
MITNKTPPHPDGLYLWAAGHSLAGDRPPPLFQTKKATKAPSLLEVKKPSWLIFFFAADPQ